MTEETRTVFHDLNGTPDEPEEVVVDLKTGVAAEAPVVEVEGTPDDQTQIVQEVVEALPDEPGEVEATKPKHDSFQARLDRETRAKTRQRERADAAEQQLAEERAARAQEREQVNARLAALEKSAPSATADADLKLADAQERLTQAFADGNPAEQAKIAREMAGLELDRRIAAAKAERAQQPQTKPIAETPSTKAAPKANPKAEQWKARNAWFGKPEFKAQTDAAVAIAGQLEHEEGWDPSDEDFFAEVDARVRKAVRVPQTKSAGSTVAGTGGRDAPAGNVVRLTRADQDVMVTLKLDPTNPVHLKRYAQEKRAANV